MVCEVLGFWIGLLFCCFRFKSFFIFFGFLFLVDFIDYVVGLDGIMDANVFMLLERLEEILKM